MVDHTYPKIFWGLLLTLVALLAVPTCKAASYRCVWEKPSAFRFTIFSPQGVSTKDYYECSYDLEEAFAPFKKLEELEPKKDRFYNMPIRQRYDATFEDYRHLAFDMEDLSVNRTPSFQRLAYRTNYVQGMHFFMVGILAIMPNSVTNWTDDDKTFGGAIDRWKENVKEGPQVDSDDGFLNWVAHPWMGGGYYVMARKCGMTKWESFGYSLFASTILWEYGVEAIAEEPSKQDLWITPILGSMLGELALREEARVKRNGRRIWGSRTLGDIWLWLLNPFWRVTSSMARDLNNLGPWRFRTEFFRDVQVFPIEHRDDIALHERPIKYERTIGIRIKVPF